MNERLKKLLSGLGLTGLLAGSTALIGGTFVLTTSIIIYELLKKDKTMSFNLEEILKEIDKQLQNKKTRDLFNQVASNAGLVTKKEIEQKLKPINQSIGEIKKSIGNISIAISSTSIRKYIKETLKEENISFMDQVKLYKKNNKNQWENYSDIDLLFYTFREGILHLYNVEIKTTSPKKTEDAVKLYNKFSPKIITKLAFESKDTPGKRSKFLPFVKEITKKDITKKTNKNNTLVRILLC